MKQHSKILGFGLAALMSVGLVAAPGLASAQSYRHKSRTHSEDGARTNAIALGAAGLLLMGNHQQTLGTIALGAAALQTIQMQNDIKNRHDRESRYGYDSYGYPYSSTHGIYSDGGYYDEMGMYHKPSYNQGYYNQSDSWNRSGDDDHDRDDRNTWNQGNGRNRGRDWAATRGNKNGWDKNGKREDSDRSQRNCRGRGRG